MNAKALLLPQLTFWRPTSGLAGRSPRIESIDILRGLVIVLMALDHIRDFFTNTGLNPTDPVAAGPALFLTRWITHFCAPVFVFLAGTSAYLSSAGRLSVGELSRFLLTRGLWLILLELTLVRFGLTFYLPPDLLILQVIWALGCSMIVLAVLIHLPAPVVGAIGALMVVGHNALDGFNAEDFGSLAPIWQILHEPGLLSLAGGHQLLVIYPLIPWIGVMALGYFFGSLLSEQPARRSLQCLVVGFGLVLAFLLLRALNSYGDPRAWTTGPTPSVTLLSFINCEKYPPSLLFLLMTLGPAVMILGLLERWRFAGSSFALIFGRVPLFFYVIHFPFIHALAVLAAFVDHGNVGWLFHPLPFVAMPAEHGFSLLTAYGVWLVVVAALFPVCRWYAQVKASNPSVIWLRYA